MPSKTDLIKFFKKQIELENKIVETANKSASDVQNVLIKELIQGIALDSKKHASLLESAIELLEEHRPLIGPKERRALAEDIKTHIKLEEEAISTYQQLVKQVEHEKLKLILSYLIEDEKRHHRLLTRIDHWIIEEEAINEEELWDIMWKDSVFHGTPGG
ncbi:MAG: ferritin family protein [Candidatus Odinarchaeia archaeon]